MLHSVNNAAVHW